MTRKYKDVASGLTYEDTTEPLDYDVPGHPKVKARLDPTTGQFYEYPRYAGSVQGSTLAALAAYLDSREAARQEKVVRSAELAKARAAATPAKKALLIKHRPFQLETVTVRGTHAITGRWLITRESGTKTQVERYELLRELSETERAELLAVAEKADRFNQTLATAVRFGTVADQLTQTISTRYVPTLGKWVATVLSEGGLYTLAEAETLHDLRSRCLNRLMYRTHPWTVKDHNEQTKPVHLNVDADTQYTRRNRVVFRTEEEAAQYCLLKDDYQRACREQHDLLERYRLVADQQD